MIPLSTRRRYAFVNTTATDIVGWLLQPNPSRGIAFVRPALLPLCLPRWPGFLNFERYGSLLQTLWMGSVTKVALWDQALDPDSLVENIAVTSLLLVYAESQTLQKLRIYESTWVTYRMYVCENFGGFKFCGFNFVDCTHHENTTPTKISASTVGHAIELRFIKTDIAAFLQV